jgi:hypothetical protein
MNSSTGTGSGNVVSNHPAETGGGLAAAGAAILILALDLGPEWSAPLIVLAGAVPGVITGLGNWIARNWGRA